jgi:hypothetical protein
METNNFENCGKLIKLGIQHELFTNLPAGFAKNCTNLEGFSITYSELSTLDANALIGLINLKQIVLIDNKITCIPTGFFSYTPLLYIIFLFNNRITALDPLIFKGLINIQNINFNNNSISFVPKLDLTGTASSDQTTKGAIFLSENPIKAIHPQLFESIPSKIVIYGSTMQLPTSSPLDTCHANQTWQVDLDNWDSVKSSFAQCFNNWTPAMASYVVSCGITTTTLTTLQTTTTTTSKLPATIPAPSCPSCNQPKTSCCQTGVLEVILSAFRNLTFNVNFNK